MATVNDQQNKDVITSVRSSGPVAAAAIIDRYIDQNAAKTTAIQEIPSYLAKGAARSRMTDEKRRKRQRAGEKQCSDCEMPEQRAVRREKQRVRIRESRDKAEAKARKRNSEGVKNVEIT